LLETKVPNGICDELACWICVSWVLRLPDKFAAATAVASKKVTSGGLFKTEYGYVLADIIPIPEAITSE
jgi:hypothetical protein